jgi:lipopolysaccharide export system protein LptA
MENLYPDIKRPPQSVTSRILLGVLAGASLLMSGPARAAADIAVPAIAPGVPITIDADSSEFDYETRKLVFHGLRMDQGTLGIKADLAETDKLDFTDGTWIFTGNVVIETENATLLCDQARFRFIDHELTAAELKGAPARFEQRTQESGKMNSGQARKIIYDLITGTLRLLGEAQFTDGSNEISGDLITYDIEKQHLTADSGKNGPVKIVIEPPTRQSDTIDTP